MACKGPRPSYALRCFLLACGPRRSTPRADGMRAQPCTRVSRVARGRRALHQGPASAAEDATPPTTRLRPAAQGTAATRPSPAQVQGSARLPCRREGPGGGRGQPRAPSPGRILLAALEHAGHEGHAGLAPRGTALGRHLFRLGGRRHFLDEHLDDRGVREGGHVPELVRLAAGDLAQDPAHDFARARLWKARHADDGVRGGDPADLLAHLALEVEGELPRVVVAVREDAVGEDADPLYVVGHPHHGGLHARRVRHEGRLDLRGAQAVARHVEHVVHPARDPIIAVRVAAAAIPGEVAALVGAHVRVQVALVVAVHGAGHPWPGLRDAEHPLHVVPLDLLPGLRVHDGRAHPKHGQRGGAGLHGRAAREPRDHVPAGLRLPEGVHHGAPLLADLLEVPLPRLRVDGLPHRAEHAEA
mmetsp:Transcript_3083/g.10143  ORF Transcript_3083/g.10143 Transcript_3083/m.10143 type:complete len:416 (+) Transcript_3083:290-1537(+)